MNSVSIIVLMLGALSAHTVEGTFLPDSFKSSTPQSTYVQPDGYQPDPTLVIPEGVYQPGTIRPGNLASGAVDPVFPSPHEYGYVREPAGEPPSATFFRETPTFGAPSVGQPDVAQPSTSFQPVDFGSGTVRPGFFNFGSGAPDSYESPTPDLHAPVPPVPVIPAPAYVHSPAVQPPSASYEPTTPSFAVPAPAPFVPYVPYVPTPSGGARRRIASIDLDPESAKCPAPLSACAINKGSAWECLDLQEELSSCGKCGHDCLSMPHVANVGCQAGVCKIFSCAAPHKLTQQLDPTSGQMVEACV